MLPANILWNTIFIVLVHLSSAIKPAKTSFPCSKQTNVNGFCVPKRECCSTNHWTYNKYDHGNCHYEQFCCTETVLCQSKDNFSS